MAVRNGVGRCLSLARGAHVDIDEATGGCWGAQAHGSQIQMG